MTPMTVLVILLIENVNSGDMAWPKCGTKLREYFVIYFYYNFILHIHTIPHERERRRRWATRGHTYACTPNIDTIWIQCARAGARACLKYGELCRFFASLIFNSRSIPSSCLLHAIVILVRFKWIFNTFDDDFAFFFTLLFIRFVVACWTFCWLKVALCTIR